MADNYKLSMFVKEELPTWAELHEWYQYYQSHDKGGGHYKPGDEGEIERYWRIPRSLYLLALVCNQMNKMLIEDGYLDVIKKTLSDQKILIDKIFFLLTKNGDVSDNSPCIYTFQDPNDNPFILNKDIRFMVSPDKEYQLTIVVDEGYMVDRGMNTGKMSLIKDLTFETLFKDVEEYFKEPIGWKDENGNLLSDMSKSSKCDSGIDPAL